MPSLTMPGHVFVKRKTRWTSLLTLQLFLFFKEKNKCIHPSCQVIPFSTSRIQKKSIFSPICIFSKIQQITLSSVFLMTHYYSPAFLPHY